MLGQEDAFLLWPRDARDRFIGLVRDTTRHSPDWTARFLRWLRTATPMRYPALAGAAAFAAERLAAGRAGLTRQVVASVLARADDPGLFLGYWRAVHGRALPKPVKRGVADAVTRLYDERALLAHDTGHARLAIPRTLLTMFAFPTYHGAERFPGTYRFGDVIALVHPRARDRRQADLFRHALDRRHGSRAPVPASLPLVRRHRLLGGRLPGPGDPVTPADLGLTWKRAPGMLRRPLDAGDWERLLPSMPLAEVVRCLTLLDAARIPFETAMTVASRLSDPAAVRASGLLPIRLETARKALAHRRWAPVLERAAAHALEALPRIPGRTLLILGDTSDIAVVFGLTLAQRCDGADVVTAGGRPFDLVPGESPLHGLDRWQASDLPTTPSKAYHAVARSAFAGHDRVVIAREHHANLPDGDLDVPAPVYTWAHAGPASAERRDRLVFPNITDAAYPVIIWAEAAARGDYPF